MWTALQIQEINRIYDKLQCMKYKHEYSEIYCNRIHKCLSYPTHLISTITGTIGGMSITGSENNLLLPSLSILSSCLNMTLSFLSYGEKSILHKQYKFKILTLITEIEVQMSHPTKDAQTFLIYASDKLISLSNGGSPNYSFMSDWYLEREITKNPELINNQSKFKIQSLGSPPSTPAPMIRVEEEEYRGQTNSDRLTVIC